MEKIDQIGTEWNVFSIAYDSINLQDLKKFIEAKMQNGYTHVSITEQTYHGEPCALQLEFTKE